MSRSGGRSARTLGAVAHLCLAALVGMLLVAAGRPLITDDLWWHIALGRAYAAGGPWLSQDPLLHTATSAPAPTAWLFDVGTHALVQSLGLDALRALHVFLVLSVLSLAWRLLWRASRSPAIASLGTSAFIALAAYRLFQFRPGLLSMLLAILVYMLFIAPPRLTTFRAALAAPLCALWANLHAGFLLGPLLLGSALLGHALADFRDADRRALGTRARGLLLATGAALLGSLVNPGFASPHLSWFEAGAASPELSLVIDEWARFPLLSGGVAGLPPSPLCWALVWLMLLATPLVIWRASRANEWRFDPGLATVAGLAIGLSLLAIRFTWLGLFPILLIAGALPEARRTMDTLRARTLCGACTCALAIAFTVQGDWPTLSRGLPSEPGRYAEPFNAHKYYAEAAWFLRDAEITGNLFNLYSLGGFLGYWLGPESRAFVNGTLNFDPTVVDDYDAILRILSPDGTSATDVLERRGVDVFVGVGLPGEQPLNRPWVYTTAHLERSRGWKLVFRSLHSSVYIRDDPRNPQRLERAAAYYATQGVPFDPESGFDVGAVIEHAPGWAIAHGLLPDDHAELRRASQQAAPRARLQALDRLASLHATLGDYEDALELDRTLLGLAPDHERARRRRIWCHIRLDRAEAALREARAFGPGAKGAITGHIRRVAQGYASLPSGPMRDALAALLPVFTRAEAAELIAGYPDPPAPRRRSTASAGGS